MKTQAEKARRLIRAHISDNGLNMRQLSTMAGNNGDWISNAINLRPHVLVLGLRKIIQFDPDLIEWAEQEKERRKRAGPFHHQERKAPAPTVYPIAYQRWAA